jgi:hypothetical protein
VTGAAEQFARINTELPEQTAVLLGVDLVGKLLIGVLGLVVIAAVAQHLQDLLLGDLHDSSLPLGVAFV